MMLKLETSKLDTYYISILLKNGKEDVTDVLLYAYELGARFDGNQNMYNKSAWDRALHDNSDIVINYIK